MSRAFTVTRKYHTYQAKLIEDRPGLSLVNQLEHR